MRQMTDIDVLVPTAAAAAAIALILEHGLRPVEDLPLWYVTEYVPLFRPAINLGDGAEGQFDLHWHAMQWSRQRSADDDFWAASLPVRLRGVDTRALCPADELLLAIMHGLQWGSSPTYRWVLDATMIARGLSGPVDFERLVTQARRRRVAPAVRAGLNYLREIAEVDIPPGALRALRVAAPLQRLELRAMGKQRGSRGAVGQAAARHGQYLRREVPPGTRLTPVGHLRLAGRRLGIQRASHLRFLLRGGRPGPGRPYVQTEPPIGTGACEPPPVPWGVPIELNDPGTVRKHCMYGMWFPEAWGCWIAGREARLALTLPEPADSALLLELVAGVAEACPRQGLQILLDGEQVASVVFDGDRLVHSEVVVLPAALVQHRSRLDIVLRVPKAASPARIGTGDDLRPLGVFLERLALRPVLGCSPGQRLCLGVGTGDERMLAGGWTVAGSAGR